MNLRLVLLWSGIGLALGHAWSLREWMLDDAFIFFRYAENWSAGHGLVFNPGEAPVEGFTSFLWLTLLTIGCLVGVDPVTGALVLGYSLAAATLFLVYSCWRWVPRIDARSAAIAAFFTGTCGAFAPWAQSGMETVLHAFLVTAMLSVWLWARDGSGRACALAGTLMALAAMNRPDALLLVAVAGLDACRVLLRRDAGGRRRLSALALLAGAFLLVFGTFYLCRFAYFGYAFPNTFYAKVGASGAQVWRGLAYAVDALPVLAPFSILVAVAAWHWRRVYDGLGVVLATIGVHSVYVIAVGGDVMPAHRFFTPLVPWLALLAARPLSLLAQATTRWAVVAMVGVYGVVIAPALMPPSAMIVNDVVAHNGRVVGVWLREHAPDGAVVATNTAGAVVYYSGLRAIDMLGLNDLHIARQPIENPGAGHAGHERGDGGYVLERNPEFIQLGTSVGWAPLPTLDPLPPFPGDRQLWSDPRFHERYSLYHTDGETVWPGGRRLGKFGFYVRKDVLPALPE